MLVMPPVLTLSLWRIPSFNAAVLTSRWRLMGLYPLPTIMAHNSVCLTPLNGDEAHSARRREGDCLSSIFNCMAHFSITRRECHRDCGSDSLHLEILQQNEIHIGFRRLVEQKVLPIRGNTERSPKRRFVCLCHRPALPRGEAEEPNVLFG